MVRKRDEAAPVPGDHVPRLPDAVLPSTLGDACPRIDVAAYDFTLAGSPSRFGDYAVGEKIDHVDGITVEEAEHQIATRLYQNTARIHFNQYTEGKGRFGRRLIYGGHVISLARALSFNGLANAFHVAAINGGRHVAPLFAGGTVFAWSEVLGKSELPGRQDVGALRLRTIAARDRPCADFPFKSGADYDPAILLDLDYWVLMPRELHGHAGLRKMLTSCGRRAAARQAAEQMVSSRTAQGSVSGTTTIAMVRATRRAVLSGTMPMPTLHSTRRHTASKLRNCTRSRSGCPMRAALSARKRCNALARSRPTKS
jgi:acyl dehydratase